MKRMIAMILLAATVACLAGCASTAVKKGEDGNWDITGTWKVTNSTLGLVETENVGKATADDRFTFNTDNSFYSTVTGKNHPYRVTGGQIIADGKTYWIDIDGSKMTWWLEKRYFVEFKRISLLDND